MSAIPGATLWADPYGPLVVSGDLDLDGSIRLQEQVRDAVLAGRTDLTVDLAGVDFIDCAGVGALVATRRKLESLGGGLALSGTNRVVARVLELLGMRESFASAPACA